MFLWIMWIKAGFQTLNWPSFPFIFPPWASYVRWENMKVIIDSEMNFHRHCSGLIAERPQLSSLQKDPPFFFALKHACSIPQGPSWCLRQWRNSDEHRLRSVPPPRLSPHMFMIRWTWHAQAFIFPLRHWSDPQHHAICQYRNFQKV